ncbi:MAG TPA: ATP-binding protein [Salinimicrobium sp.]|nr:ATP-binding protein [Salinimicrobium sp.]
MGKKLKRSYKFAVRTSLYIALFLGGISTIFLIVADAFSFLLLFGYTVSCFVFSFLIIQYRLENFIYKRIKKIYSNLKLLDINDLKSTEINTDITSLSQEVEKFAQIKKLEIENLKLQENYRKEFIGNISHELRTPLFTVQGYIFTLLDGAVKDKTVRKKYLKRAGKGVERLIHIVKDLEMITKLENRDLHLNMEDFDIVTIIEDVFDLLEMKAAKKNITLSLYTTSRPVRVYADAEKIEQVIINLVVNSIKYGRNDGATEIFIEDHGKDQVIIRIADNGEGIEKKYIPRLFERFFRVDQSRSRKEGGSGLGLSIVKHILEAHHQRISVESTYKTGSEFSFTLEKFKKSL